MKRIQIIVIISAVIVTVFSVYLLIDDSAQTAVGRLMAGRLTTQTKTKTDTSRNQPSAKTATTSTENKTTGVVSDDPLFKATFATAESASQGNDQVETSLPDEYATSMASWNADTATFDTPEDMRDAMNGQNGAHFSRNIIVVDINATPHTEQKNGLTYKYVRSLADAADIATAGDTISLARNQIFRANGYEVTLTDVHIFGHSSSLVVFNASPDDNSYVLNIEGGDNRLILNGFSIAGSARGRVGTAIRVHSGNVLISNIKFFGRNSEDFPMPENYKLISGIKAVSDGDIIVQNCLFDHLYMAMYASADRTNGSTAYIFNNMFANDSMIQLDKSSVLVANIFMSPDFYLGDNTYSFGYNGFVYDEDWNVNASGEATTVDLGGNIIGTEENPKLPDFVAGDSYFKLSPNSPYKNTGWTTDYYHDPAVKGDYEYPTDIGVNGGPGVFNKDALKDL